MKKIILIPVLIVVLIMDYQTGFTQSENCEPKEMNTNPDITPSQVHLDNIPQDGGGPDLRFINDFYWWTDPNNIATIPLEDMGLTSGDYYDEMQPINSQFYINHYMYLNHLHREVMRPENGWEILSMNTGVYPDNSTGVDMSINSPLRSIPYLLFYNKYSGMARIFVRYGVNSDPTTSINTAEIHIKYPDEKKMSGILRHAEGLDQPLDIPSDVQVISSRVPSPGDENLWFSTDFQLAYDPCVCEYESQLNIYFKFFHEAEIEVAGFFQSATQDLSPEDLYSSNSYNQNFLNAMTNNMDKAGDGYVVYQHMNDLVDDYLERLSVYEQNVATTQSYNSGIEKQKSIMKIAKLIFSMAAGTALPSISSESEYQNNVDNVDELKNQADKDDFGPETQKAFFKEFNKSMSTGFDLLISNSFNTKTMPSAPNMPTASFGEMKFSGTLSSATETSGPTIKTPGSLNSNLINAQKPTQFPIYNESVGVFALLNSPEIIVSKEKSEDCYVYSSQAMIITGQDATDNQNIDLLKAESENKIQFRLKNDLDYTFNPALDIKEYSIDVGFEFRGEMFNDGPCYPNFLNMEIPHYTEQSILPQYSASIESNSFNPYENESLKKIIPNNCDCSIPGMSYEHCGSSSVLNRNPITYSTVSVPIDAVKSFIYGFGYKNEWANPGFETSDISISQRDAYYDSEYNDCNALLEGINYDIEGKYFMKLKVNVIFEGEHLDGSPKEYTYFYTYEIDEDKVELLTGSSLSAQNQNYNQNINFEGVHFDGSFVPGCVLDGTTYTCSAIDDITLIGDYTVTQGYEVVFEAGNEIRVNDESSLMDEITLQVSPLDVSDPMPPVESGVVSDFCQNEDRYKARTLNSPTINTDSIIVNEEEKRDIFDFNIFPNPTNGNVTATISLNENSEGQLFITDMNGRVLKTAFNNQTLNAGASRYQLSTETLSKGLYLVHLIVDGESHVKRLVKQ